MHKTDQVLLPTTSSPEFPKNEILVFSKLGIGSKNGLTRIEKKKKIFLFHVISTAYWNALLLLTHFFALNASNIQCIML